jgi:CHAT domain-containing protein
MHCATALGSDSDAEALRAKAHQLCREEKFEEASRLAEQAVALAEKTYGPQAPDTAAALAALSEAYEGLGQYERALEVGERALLIRETARGPEDLETAESLNDVGVLYLYLKQPERGATPIERALAIRRDHLPGNDPALAESEANWASVHSARAVALDAKGRRDEAIAELQAAVQGFKRALDIKEQALGSNDRSTCGVRTNLSATYLRLAKYATGGAQAQLNTQAQEQAVKAKQCSNAHQEAPESLTAASAKINQAWALWRQNISANARGVIVLDQVHDLFKDAATIRERILGPDHPDTAQALVMLATSAQAMGDYRGALELLKRALEAEDRMLATFVATGDEEQRLALVQQAQGHYWATLSMIRRHLAKDRDAVRLGLDLVLRRKGIILDVETRVRNALSQHLDAASLDSWGRLVDLQTELSNLLVQGPGTEPAAYRQRLKELRDQIAREEQNLSQHSAIIAEELAQRNVSAAAVAQQLPKDAVLVEYVLIRDWDDQGLGWLPTSRYLAFVLTPQNEITLVDLGESDAIDKALRTAFSAIEDPHAFADPVGNQHLTDAALGRLYTLLIEPMGSIVTSHRTWILSPDGELNKVPFPALRKPGGEYLVETQVLSLVTSGRDLLRRQPTKPSNLALLMVANPTFDSDQGTQPSSSRRRRRGETEPSRLPFRYRFGPLPSTKEEAQIIEPLIQGRQKILTEDGATEGAVWDVVDQSPPRVMHFATHGVFEGAVAADPPAPSERASPNSGTARQTDLLMRSFLTLAGVDRVQTIQAGVDDGVLYAAEVADMDLHGTDLVVLSACQTGLGDIRNGEGVYGLRRAFVLAGAQNLVMSLWSVADEETRDLMKYFYNAYAKGVVPRQALQAAEVEMLKELRASNQNGTARQPVAPVVLWAAFEVQQSSS